ncbi:hypothetical protein H1C71_008494 [Ictidomys tridecemlineatus]|nr:hypothetical protein H1C71_008494 [Ictidomys tridecemlineatus]
MSEVTFQDSHPTPSPLHTKNEIKYADQQKEDLPLLCLHNLIPFFPDKLRARSPPAHTLHCTLGFSPMSHTVLLLKGEGSYINFSTKVLLNECVPVHLWGDIFVQALCKHVSVILCLGLVGEGENI